MSDEQGQTFEEAVNVFYPDDATTEPLEVPTDEAAKDELPEETYRGIYRVEGEEAEAESGRVSKAKNRKTDNSEDERSG